MNYVQSSYQYLIGEQFKGNQNKMKKSKLASSQEIISKVTTGELTKSRSYLIGKSFQNEQRPQTVNSPSTPSVVNPLEVPKKSVPNIAQTQKTQNLFTQKDTRYQEISNLRSRNKLLSSRLHDLEDDLKQIDEFRIALNLEHSIDATQKQMEVYSIDSYKRTTVFRSLEVQRKADRPPLVAPELQQRLMGDRENNLFNQRRVDILKAQVQKQQRYINRLTTIFQSTRSFFDELKQFVKYFSQVLSNQNQGNKLFQVNPNDIIYTQSAVIRDVQQAVEKVQQKIESTNNDFEDSFEQKVRAGGKPNKLSNVKDITENNDKKQQYVSLKTLLQMFRSNEEKDTFVNNFHTAYQKVLEYERQNVEFQQMFEVSTPMQKQVKKNSQFSKEMAIQKVSHKNVVINYRHPIRTFIKQFGNYFPIRTIFNSFPMKEKEKLEHFLISLEGISSQIGVNFRKIDTFHLFSGNPFFYQSEVEAKQERKSRFLELPYTLLDEREFFEKYAVQPERFRTIQLDQKMLNHLEGDLAVLLDQILNFQKLFFGDAMKPEFLQNLHVANLSTQIRKCLESLVCVSTVVGGGSNQRLNKIQIVLDSIHSNKQSIYRHPQSEDSQHSNQIKELAYVYSFEIQSATNFEQLHNYLESIQDDFLAQFERDDIEYVMVRKSQSTLKSIKNVFDIQKMLIQIKNCEIEYLKSKNHMLEVDLEVFRTFMQHAQTQIEQFFTYIDNKMQNLQSAFVNFIDQGKIEDIKIRKTFTLTFKRTVKEMTDWINKFKDLDYKDNVINIQQLRQEFAKRVNFFYVKSEALARRIEQRQKDMEQDAKHSKKNYHSSQ